MILEIQTDISDKIDQSIAVDRSNSYAYDYLQVSVLSEQVGAQKEKIRDLEALLAAKRNSLTSSEELLQGVGLGFWDAFWTATFLVIVPFKKYHYGGECSDVDSKKLNLMAEVSSLKLKFATLEQEKNEAERKLKISQVSSGFLSVIWRILSII